jgi:hypothetical protein
VFTFLGFLTMRETPYRTRSLGFIGFGRRRRAFAEQSASGSCKCGAEVTVILRADPDRNDQLQPPPSKLRPPLRASLLK